ncbi:MAG: hypothetical protein LBS70_04235, partial [Candidatus Accumulibacter sp.]|nr:hypothetical protein [Accumulibacter sp.]
RGESVAQILQRLGRQFFDENFYQQVLGGHVWARPNGETARRKMKGSILVVLAAEMDSSIQPVPVLTPGDGCDKARGRYARLSGNVGRLQIIHVHI